MPLDSKLREMLIFRVAYLGNHTYGLLRHRRVAQKVGWSAEEIAAILSGQGCALGELFEETVT